MKNEKRNSRKEFSTAMTNDKLIFSLSPCLRVCVSKCMQAYLTPSVSGVKVNSIITFLPAYKTACECLALFFLLYFTTTFSFVQFANGVHTHTHAVQNWRRLTFCNKEKVAKKEEKWTNERTKGGRKEQHQLNVHTHTLRYILYAKVVAGVPACVIVCESEVMRK